MIIETNPEMDGIVLKKVFLGVGLMTESKEYIGICMRDSGFEFNYGGFWYSAQKGEITKLGKSGYDLEGNKIPSSIVTAERKNGDSE